MLRSALIALALVAVPAGSVLAQEAPSSSSSSSSSSTAASDRTKAQLSSSRLSLDFEDAPVADVVRYLAKTSGLNIVIDGAALRRLTDDDQRLSLSLQEVPLETILKLACEMLDLRWRVQGAIVVLRDRDGGWGPTTLRTYDLRDLLIAPRDHTAPFRDLFGALTKNTKPAAWDNEYGLHPEEIEELIKGSIAQEYWDHPDGSVIQVGGTLMIKCPADVHASIAQMLNDLRAIRNLRVAVELTVIDAPADFARTLRATIGNAPALTADGDRLLTQALESGQAVLRSRSSISGYNSQQVALRDGTQLRVDLPTGSPTPQAVLHDGLTAQVRPVLVAGGRDVRLRARVQYAGDHRHTPGGHGLDALTIDTAFVAPLNTTLLLGGGSRGVAPAGEERSRETLLLMRVTTPNETRVPVRYGSGDADGAEADAAPTHAKLAAMRMTCDFNATPLVEVAAFLAQQTKVNMVIGEQVFDEFSEEDLRINLQLKEVSALDVLRLIADLTNLQLAVHADYVSLHSRGRRADTALAIYDVRDLTQPGVFAPPHNPDLTAAPGDRGPIAGNDVEALITADTLADVIREAIDPESWDTPPNSLEPTSEFLIVRNQPDVLRKVDALLAQMRATAHRTLLVEALFLDVTEAEWTKRGLGRVLTAAQVDSITGDAAAGKGLRLVASGRVAGFNDQRFSLHAGRQLASFDQATGPLFAADGVVLDIQPVLSADRSLVHCDVDIRRRRAGAKGTLEPGLPVQELRTHLKVPAGGAVALGAFAVPGKPGSLLVLRVTPAK